MASIYFGKNSDQFIIEATGDIDAKFSKTNEIFDKCSTFKVVKCKIIYSSLQEQNSNTTNPESYSLHIYSGYSSPNSFDARAEYKYYYCPSKKENIVSQVDSYYNILNDCLPFALVFTTNGGIKKCCMYDQLDHKLNPRELPGTLIQDRTLCKRLHTCFKKTQNQTLQLRVASGKNQNVEPKEQEIGSEKFKKVIFVPKSGVQNLDSLPLCIGKFTLEAENDSENEIGHSCLDKVKDQNFESVKVYYCSNNDSGCSPILIELVKDCETTHIRRITNNPARWVKDDVRYGNDEELISRLSSIKEVVDGAIIYELDKNDNVPGYGVESVIVANDQEKLNSGYNIYTHVAIRRDVNKVILLYNDKAIELLPNEKIEHNKLKTSDIHLLTQVSTYTLSNNDKEHLLIRVTIRDINYYLYRFSNDGSKWKQLGLDELSEFRVKAKEELSDFEADLSIRGLSVQLQKLLEDRSKHNVKPLLNHISLIVNSTFVLLDQKSQYDQSEINPLIKNEMKLMDINSIMIDPKDCTDKIGPCINSNGYKVYKHDLTKPVEFAKTKLLGSKLYLSFYLNNNPIGLYDSFVGNHNYLQFKGVSDLYVYFYGDTDPRPLLFCYGGSAYRPSSKEEYESKWVKVEKIRNCVCQGNDVKELLDVLSQVIGFLNLVRLKHDAKTELFQSEDPNTDGIDYYQYSLQTLGSTIIYIKLTHKNKKCYRVYTHEPYSSHGGLGYRLGEIKYIDKSLTYDLTKQLAKVSVYYHVYDQSHQYPLLVVLEFNDTTNTDNLYYKLSNKEKKEWVKIEDISDKEIKKLKDSDKIEDWLYDLREGLEIEFDKKITPLFKTDECEEDSINVKLVAGTTVGTAAVVATVASVGVLVSKNIAASAAAAAAATIAL